MRTNLSALTSTSSTVSAVLDRVAPSLTGLTLGVTPALSTVAQRTVAFVRPLDAATVTAQVIDAANADVGAPVTLAGNGGTVALGSTDGDYRVRLTFTDAAGNSVQTTSGTLTLDATAPGGGAPTVAGAGSSRQRTVTFARDADVTSALVEVLDANGLVVISESVASGASVGVTLPDTDGAYAVRVTQTDAAAHVTVSATTAIELDRVAPVPGGAPIVDGAPGALTVRFARAQDAATAAIEVLDATGTVLFTVAVPSGDHATVALPAAPGVYGVRAVQADAAGNVSRTAVTPVTRAAVVVPPAAGRSAGHDPDRSGSAGAERAGDDRRRTTGEHDRAPDPVPGGAGLRGQRGAADHGERARAPRRGQRRERCRRRPLLRAQDPRRHGQERQAADPHELRAPRAASPPAHRPGDADDPHHARGRNRRDEAEPADADDPEGQAARRAVVRPKFTG